MVRVELVWDTIDKVLVGLSLRDGHGFGEIVLFLYFTRIWGILKQYGVSLRLRKTLRLIF